MIATSGATGRRLRQIALVALVAAAAWYSGLRLYSFPGASMAPAIEPGSTLLGLVGPWSLRDPRRFDVVIFDVPAPSPWAGKGIPWVKRVVGLPGETIRLDGTTLYIDGRRIDQTHLRLPKSQLSRPAFEICLGPDEYCVLGDNLAESLDDSRSFGPVTRARLRGRIGSVVLSP